MSSKTSSQITYLLNIAIDINKKVGGVKAYQAERKAKDKFSVLKDQISKKIHIIRNAIERKPFSQGMSTWTQQQDQQLKEKLRDINSCLIRIRQSVQDEKSNQNAKNLKFQIIQKLQEQYKVYDQLIYSTNDPNSERAALTNKNQFHTLTDMKAQLLSDNPNDTVFSNNSQRKNLNDHVTEIQMQKMEEWQKRQKVIDDNVDVINDKIYTLKGNIAQAGNLVNQIDAKVKKITTNVQNLTDDLSKSNKKLKGIIQKFRAPHKFCCDVILTLIFIGLIIACIKVSSGPTTTTSSTV